MIYSTTPPQGEKEGLCFTPLELCNNTVRIEDTFDTNLSNITQYMLQPSFLIIRNKDKKQVTFMEGIKFFKKIF